MERIILHIMIFQGHHEGNEGLGRYCQRFEQISTLEGRVRHTSEGSIITKFAYPEDVDAPFIDVREQL